MEDIIGFDAVVRILDDPSIHNKEAAIKRLPNRVDTIDRSSVLKILRDPGVEDKDFCIKCMPRNCVVTAPKKVDREKVCRITSAERFAATKSCMTKERALQIAFCTLQLIRQYREKQGYDPADTDDLLFSELDIEKGELEEIYSPYHVIVRGDSCFEDGHSPKDYDRNYFDR